MDHLIIGKGKFTSLKERDWALIVTVLKAALAIAVLSFGELTISALAFSLFTK